MQTVLQLLESKSPDIYTVTPELAVIDALRLMAEKKIGAVLVMEQARLVGIFSERDYARKVVLNNRASTSTQVKEIMTADPVTVPPTTRVGQCLELMTERRIRHLPVVEDDKVLGLISIGDLVKAVIEQQRRELDQLQQYIVSG